MACSHLFSPRLLIRLQHLKRKQNKVSKTHVSLLPSIPRPEMMRPPDQESGRAFRSQVTCFFLCRICVELGAKGLIQRREPSEKRSQRRASHRCNSKRTLNCRQLERKQANTGAGEDICCSYSPEAPSEILPADFVTAGNRTFPSFFQSDKSASRKSNYFGILFLLQHKTHLTHMLKIKFFKFLSCQKSRAAPSKTGA